MFLQYLVIKITAPAMCQAILDARDMAENKTDKISPSCRLHSNGEGEETVNEHIYSP